MKIVYRPTARVLTVLELLQAQGRRTGTELARRQEVDIRTVRNYIQTLADLGVPISAERGSYGAYFLRPGYKLPPLTFTEDESLALTLSLLVTREHGLAQTFSAFEGCWPRSSACFRKQHALASRRWSSRVARNSQHLRAWR